MKLRLVFTFVLICLYCTASFAQSALSPLDGISTLRDFRAMRSSSSDPNLDGNGDCRAIAPGDTLTIADVQGPGKIAHVWFTIADNERNYGKLLVLRMYWDGEKNPSVECPMNDFFCEGHGMDVQVDSLPIRVTSNGKGRNCYWPMPFGKSAKITVTNEGKEHVGALYWYVDWQKMDKLPKDSGYFHAQYRQEYPCIQGRDYLILDAEGKGQYVGCNLSVRQREPGWWGEGDDKFYIDGEETPSLCGTGSEDYFCDGWGIRKLDGLYYGFPISEGYDTFCRHTSYRFHIQDPVPFKKSLRMAIEHKGSRTYPDGKNNGYVERADDFSSVAYWYQTEPHKKFPSLPEGKDRIYNTNSILIEGESLLQDSKASEGQAIKQELFGWSGGAQLFYTPQKSPASLAIKFNVQRAGKYFVMLSFTKSWDYGIYQAYLNNRPVGKPADLYSSDVVLALPLKLGIHDLAEGQNEIRFELLKKNESSGGYYFGLDVIELVPIL